MSEISKCSISGEVIKKLSKVQFYADNEVRLDNCKKLISLDSCIIREKYEVVNNEIKILLKVGYSFIYLDESSLICSNYITKEFSFNYSTSIKVNNKVCMSSAIISCEFVGGRDVKTRLTIETGGIVIEKSVCDCISDKNESIIIKKEIMMMECITEMKDAEILINDDISIKGGIDKILCVKTTPYIRDKSAQNDVVHIDIDIFTEITYLKDNNICCNKSKTNKTFEILADGAIAESMVYLTVCKESESFYLNDGKESVRAEICLLICGIFIDKKEKEIITDLFSLSKEISISKGVINVNENNCMTLCKEKINGSIRIGHDKEKVRTIVCVKSPIVGSIGTMMEGKIIVCEGVVTAEVIYIDEKEDICSIIGDIPFQIKLNESFDCFDNIIEKGYICNESVKLRHNDEIEIMMDLYIEIFGTKEKERSFIKEIEFKCEKEINDAVISLYIATANESIFEIAKQLNKKEETILLQNQDISFPLKGGEKIIVMNIN